MATYRTVVNVPSVKGSNETMPTPLAQAVIEYGIKHGNIDSTHKEDWLEIVGSGRLWEHEYRQDMPRRVSNLESDVVALASTLAKQLAVNAAHLQAHDAMMSLMREHDARLVALEST